MAATFGIDFGTTNSLVTAIALDPETNRHVPFRYLDDNVPHPSVIWYQGDQPIAGRRALAQLGELGLGVFGDIVRSPKMFLGSFTGINVGGVTRWPVDLVADLLRYLRQDALRRTAQTNPFETAVVTIPITMQGPARQELREAAQKAGIQIHQVVHEPLAALYGYFRSRSDFRQELANLERRLVLVFDWGGGTLDLTLCQLQDGTLTQILSSGDREVGGDTFDLRLRQLVRDKHQVQYPKVDWSRMQPNAEARLIGQCADAKIALSTRSGTGLYVPNLLASSGLEKDLDVRVTRHELEQSVSDLVAAGLSRIDTLLSDAGLHRGAIEFCLATGGMVSMPAIHEGLREIFGLSRLRRVENAATVISEGAAWIAHDEIGLELAKPIELLHADNSYIEVIPAGTGLPGPGRAISRHIDMYCVDPSDGLAKFLFARPRWPGRAAHGDARVPYTHLTLPVDQARQPLFERLRVDVSIDHDLIVEVTAHSLMRQVTRRDRIHDLEFGLTVQGIQNVN